MEKQELLANLGFSKYEVKVIITMLKLGVVAPKEISFDSGVPQNKIYGLLLKFETQGLIEQLMTDPKSYKIINFQSFVDAKIQSKNEVLKEMKKASKNINESGDNNFIFSLIKGQKAIMNKMAEQNLKVKKEILVVNRNWKFWSKGIRAMETSVNNGIDVRLIGVVNPETIEKVKVWKKIGCNIRAYDNSLGEYPLRFTIYDNNEARITLGKPEISNPKDYITIWTKSKPLINILRSQFMNMWKNCKPIEKFI